MTNLRLAGSEGAGRESKREAKLFADALRDNPHWEGMRLVMIGRRFVMPHEDHWVPARCRFCDRPLGAIGVSGRLLLVPPGEERSKPGVGPQYQCSNRAACERYRAEAA